MFQPVSQVTNQLDKRSGQKQKKTNRHGEKKRRKKEDIVTKIQTEKQTNRLADQQTNRQTKYSEI